MTTINQDEIQKFSTLADEWWDVNGKFKPLHMFNPIRIEYIRNSISQHFKKDLNDSLPFRDLKILDIGSGGGLVSEPMSRLGADVTGIDASEKNIKVSTLHAKKSNLKIDYQIKSPEELDKKNYYDVVLSLEVIEHVQNVDFYLKTCCSLLKKGGLIFTATINRTLTSYIKAIIGAEYILRWLPIGTHDWNKFFKPKELEDKIIKLNFKILETKGLQFNLFTQKWKKSEDLSVNYIIAVKKN